MSAANSRGKFYLIGAGPGDPELLTLKAARLLRQVDVVLYDRLVGQDILAFAQPNAELIYVGKHEGEQDTVQTQIFDLILEHALAGKTVARLKGGDPLVFGRGAEEWELALQHGIDVELVPGVSSAVSVPGLAGIPLTYRGVSQSFAIVAGHSLAKRYQPGESAHQHWRKYTGIDTLAILMGVKNRVAIAEALIAAGRTPHEPCAFVQRGTLPGEQIVESTLAQVAAGVVHAESPAVFVVGEVVKLRKSLSGRAESPTQPNPAPQD